MTSPSPGEESRRCLNCLDYAVAEKGALNLGESPDQKTRSLTPKAFIYNRPPFSQSRRRGFASRLPLDPSAL
jgi:hypothetical protein